MKPNWRRFLKQSALQRMQYETSDNLDIPRQKRDEDQTLITGEEGANSLSILTFNIHKGFSKTNRRFILHELRDAIRATAADVVFLQEVQGENWIRASRHKNWPNQPQHQFLAESFWPEYAYGKNCIYDHGHHGNAILSKFPIRRGMNVDISAHYMEERGILHCEIYLPHLNREIHTICVHLGLLQRFRLKQYMWIVHYSKTQIPQTAPLIVAGDFNDWRGEADQLLADRLQLCEAYKQMYGSHARTYPAFSPSFKLDRIYTRGFAVNTVRIYAENQWAHLSDHAGLFADLQVAPNI